MNDRKEKYHGGFGRHDLLVMRKKATQKWLASLRRNHR